MAFGDHQSQSLQRMVPDLVEVVRRVSIAEVGGPAAQDAIHVLHDYLDRQQQASSGRELTHPIPDLPHRLLRRPASKEEHMTVLLRASPHPAVVETEEVKALATLLQVHDPGLGPVSYTHLRAHETRHDLVCRLLLEKKKQEDNIYN